MKPKSATTTILLGPKWDSSRSAETNRKADDPPRRQAFYAFVVERNDTTTEVKVTCTWGYIANAQDLQWNDARRNKSFRISNLVVFLTHVSSREQTFPNPERARRYLNKLMGTKTKKAGLNFAGTGEMPIAYLPNRASVLAYTLGMVRADYKITESPSIEDLLGDLA